MSHDITFETKCYEKDWRFLIKKGRLEEMIANCRYDFAEKVLCINNVDDYPLVTREADKLIGRKIIDRYYVVREYEEQVLKHLGIDKPSFKGGYYYSIAELVSIFLCRTKYLLHFSGDAILESPDASNKPWITQAMAIMDQEKQVMVANPVWNFDYPLAKKESFKEDDDWYYSVGGFSDQCYLIRAAGFREKIYNEQHPIEGRYPDYGGELFEKRVDAFMRKNERWRMTSKHISYIHENIPSSRIRRFLYFYLNIKTF